MKTIEVQKGERASGVVHRSDLRRVGKMKNVYREDRREQAEPVGVPGGVVETSYFIVEITAESEFEAPLPISDEATAALLKIAEENERLHSSEEAD